MLDTQANDEISRKSMNCLLEENRTLVTTSPKDLLSGVSLHLDPLDRVRNSTRRITNQSKQVEIDHTASRAFLRMYRAETPTSWWTQAPCSFDTLPMEQALATIFIFNSISFSYWSDKKWTINYRNRRYDGTWAMIASLRKEVSSNPTFTNPTQLSKITPAHLEIILYSPTARIPLLAERAKILQALGSIVAARFQGKFIHLIDEADWDANRLLNILLREFEFFRDQIRYGDQTVEFHKRAQLLIADIDFYSRVRLRRRIRGVSRLTACADYKVPQALRHLGIIRYTAELSAQIDSRQPIEVGNIAELEIRAATIQAIELLAREVQGITPMNLNDHFWLMSQNLNGAMPYHRTRTTAY